MLGKRSGVKRPEKEENEKKQPKRKQAENEAKLNLPSNFITPETGRTSS